MKLSDRELGTVLAALRLWQHDRAGLAHNYLVLEDIAGHKPLAFYEIDALCERLNRDLRFVNQATKSERRTADRIDGYDRDDLGESPDY